MGQTEDLKSEVSRFSIMNGGPFYKLVLSHLERRSRAMLPILVVWFPLFLISLLEGNAFGDPARLPFAYDLTSHVRFLFALPFLLLAELPIENNLRRVTTYFADGKIIAENERGRFLCILKTAESLRNSVFAEVAILALAIGLTAIPGDLRAPLKFSTWRTHFGEHGPRNTFAFTWLLVIGLPLFQFIVLRFLWKFFIWCRVLAMIAKLSLNLVPCHPDQAGGLSVIHLVHRPFSFIPPLVFSAVLASSIGQLHIYAGVDLREYVVPVGVFFAIVAIIFLAPLLIFTPKLILARKRGLIDYGLLGEEYSNGFEGKWVEKKQTSEQTILGSPDIQSLADLYNSFGGVKRMSILLIDRESLVTVLVPLLLPMIPLLLADVPLTRLLEIVMKLFA